MVFYTVDLDLQSSSLIKENTLSWEAGQVWAWAFEVSVISTWPWWGRAHLHSLCSSQDDTVTHIVLLGVIFNNVHSTQKFQRWYWNISLTYIVFPAPQLMIKGKQPLSIGEIPETPGMQPGMKTGFIACCTRCGLEKEWVSVLGYQEMSWGSRKRSFAKTDTIWKQVQFCKWKDKIFFL